MSKIWKKAAGKAGDAHARVYGWEAATPAYRTLSCDARALLIEFRLLYGGRANRVFLSVREIMRRLNVGQRRAQHARDELVYRGWIRVIESGGFSRKARQATVYALTSEPLEERDGAVAPKDYMRWRDQFSTVADTATDGSCNRYGVERQLPGKSPDGIRGGYPNLPQPRSTVAVTATQIDYQGECEGLDWLLTAFHLGLSDAQQLGVVLAWLLIRRARTGSA